MATRKATRMTRPRPEFVSLVDHGANETQGAAIKVIKHARGADQLDPAATAATIRELRHKRSLITTFLGALGFKGRDDAPLAEDTAAVEALVFDPAQWDLERARKWAGERGYSADAATADATQLVLRQFNGAAALPRSVVEIEPGIRQILVAAPAEPSIARKATTDYALAVADYRVRQGTPKLWDLMYVFQDVLSNITYCDEIADKAAAIQGAVDAFTADLRALAAELGSAPATKRAERQTIAQLVRRFANHASVHPDDAATLITVLDNARKETITMTESAMLKTLATGARKSLPAGDHGGGQSALLNRAFTVDQMLQAWEGADSLSAMITRLAAMESPAVKAAPEPKPDPEPAKPLTAALVEELLEASATKSRSSTAEAITAAIAPLAADLRAHGERVAVLEQKLKIPTPSRATPDGGGGGGGDPTAAKKTRWGAFVSGESAVA